MEKGNDKYKSLIDEVLKKRYVDSEGWWEAAKKLLAQAVEDDENNMQARAYMELGSCMLLKSEPDEAASYMRRSIRYAKKADNISQLGNSYGMMGVIMTRQEMETLAIDYFYKAIDCLKSVGDYGSLSVHYHNMGTMYYQVNEYEKAMVCDATAKHYESLIPNGNAYAQDSGMQALFDNINPAVYLEKLGRIDEMGEKMAIIEKAYAENDLRSMSPYVNVARAKYYYRTGDYDRFREVLAEIVKDSDNVRYGMDVLRDVIDLFDYAITLRDIPYAGELIGIAYEAGLSGGSNTILVNIYSRYLWLLERTRNFSDLDKFVPYYMDALIKRDDEISKLRRNVLENLLVKDEEDRNGQSVDSTGNIDSYDALTGLPNRYYLNITMEEMYGVCAAEFRKFGIMIINIDDYTGLRNRTGHLNSDYIFKRAAEIVSEVASECFVARYDKDELCVVSKDLSTEELHRFAVFIQERLAGVRIPELQNEDGKMETITASIGIYNAIPGRSTDITEFIHRADQRMHKAKSAGKNRIELEV